MAEPSLGWCWVWLSRLHLRAPAGSDIAPPVVESRQRDPDEQSWLSRLLHMGWPCLETAVGQWGHEERKRGLEGLILFMLEQE